MKTKLLSIILLFLIGLSCIDKSNKDVSLYKSDFNLKTDFTKLTEKITEIDTVKIWADLSSCMWTTTEKIILTKSNDSLNIELKVVQMMDPEVSETIKIHKSDTTWNFNRFLANNTNRLKKTEYMTDINLKIKHNSDSLEFYTGDLGDLNIFIDSYYKSMFKLKPQNKAYKFLMGISFEKGPNPVQGIPENAFWSGNDEKGNWFVIESINSHKNMAVIYIYDDQTGLLITKNQFMKICPVNDIKFIENLKEEIDFYDGQKIQLKDNCYLKTN